jgi:hypothetical protein
MLQSELDTGLLAAETDAGSAQEQLARDNQLGVTDYLWGEPFRTVRPQPLLILARTVTDLRIVGQRFIIHVNSAILIYIFCNALFSSFDKANINEIFY